MPEWAKRVFRTKPEVDRADKRSGLTFVNILFGLVVTAAVVAFARVMVGWQLHGFDSINEARLAHLAVAIVLSTLSWVGYYQSQQNPPFLIKFINIPMEQFVLDFSMVVTYYVAVVMAEKADASASAVPETALIVVSFSLYLVWDICGFRLGRDPQYNKELNKFLKEEHLDEREPDSGYGPRRWVTVVFLGLALGLATPVWIADPTTPVPVIGIDIALICLLILYRLAKPISDRTIKIRQ